MRTLIFSAINFGLFLAARYGFGFSVGACLAMQVVHLIGYAHGAFVAYQIIHRPQAVRRPSVAETRAHIEEHHAAWKRGAR